MQRLLVLLGVVAMFAAFGAGTAFADHNPNHGGGGDKGNACPPPTPGHPAEPPPGCGQVRGDGTCHDGIDNDDDGRKDRGDSECRDPQDGCENGAPGCPNGGNGGNGGNGAAICESADLVLVRSSEEGGPVLVCLYAPGNENATAEECPGGVFLGGPGTGAICLIPQEQATARSS